HDLGARLYPASFSPIPGTSEWRKAVASGLWDPQADLLLTNTTLFPLWRKLYGWSFCSELIEWTHELNRSLDKGTENENRSHPADGEAMLCDVPESFLS
ncbi:MAG: hypothetical protein ONB12_11475, partial [candidate division KSB1 bacterium]|nr:hypothetical protein [candidate division KSB1 bacterium]